LVIPVTVLVTLVAMRMTGLSFNLMTLGGIAAAIGLVIDDAIVVVEAIYAKVAAGLSRREAIHSAVCEIFRPLVGSTLTPVVVFSAGVPGWRNGRIFPRPCAYDGCVIAYLAVAGGDTHAFACRLVH